jgi:hypothetical protein
MGSVGMRITRIAENLRVVQNEIVILAGEEIRSLDDDLLAAPDVHALRKVKASVDHLRQVLRTYIDFASTHLGTTDSEEFQRIRSERTTQILRYACEGLQLREGKEHEVPLSLFEQLTQMTIAIVDRYAEKPEPMAEAALRAAAD